MKIPAGQYTIETPMDIYRMGESPDKFKGVNHWMNFKNGTETVLHTEAHRMVYISLEMDLEVDVEKKTIRFLPREQD